MSAKNDKLDRDALHRYLHDRTDAHGKVRVVQKLLAIELDVTAETVNRIFKEFCQEGRLKKIGRELHNVSIYAVADPEVFAGGKPKPKREILWG